MGEPAGDHGGTPALEQEGQQVAAGEAAVGHGATPVQEYGGQQPAASRSGEKQASPLQEPAQQQSATGGSEETHLAPVGRPLGSNGLTVLLILCLDSVLLIAALGTIIAIRVLTSGEEPTPTQKTTPTTTTHGRAPGPVPGGKRILMCIMKFPRKDSLPPDGLCDIVVCNAESKDLATPTPWPLKDFAGFAKKLISSHGGINFIETTRDQSLAKLKTPEGENALRSLWNENIRSYGALGPAISVGTTANYIDALADLLTTLKNHQESFKGGSNISPTYIFVGVAPLYNRMADTKDIIKRHFDTVMSKAGPNLVLFQTSDLREFHKNDPGCMSNTFSPWKDPPLVDQPSFEDTLSFRKRVTLPPGTSEMLSMSLCMRAATVDKGSSFQLGEGKGCLAVYRGGLHEGFCVGGKNYHYFVPVRKLDTDRWVVLAQSKDHGTISAFETKDTIQKKMCKASVEHHYAGGWAMYGLDCNDHDNVCKDVNFTAGFARLHWMRYYMTHTFTSC